LRDGFPDSPYRGYLVMGIGAGVVICAGLLVSAFVAPRGTPAGGLPPRVSLVARYGEGIKALRASQPFRVLLLTFLLQGLATGAMLATANYVADHVLHSKPAITFLFAALIAPAVVFSPVWGVIARRIGKEAGFRWASVIFAVAAASIVVLAWAPGPWVYVPVAVCGAAYAGMQSLPLAMLPDVVTHDARQTSGGHAGTFGGMWTAGETTGMALGATVLSIVLAVTGYISTTGTAEVAQPASAVTGIVVAFSVIPAALIALSLIPLARYRLRKEDIDA
jgi:Na+/melibiose symporter-like transporter